jgi:hypothetical protein
MLDHTNEKNPANGAQPSRNEQVSGSSPLVGSRFLPAKPVKTYVLSNILPEDWQQ